MSRVAGCRVCGECGKRISGGLWGFDPNKWAYRQFPFKGHGKGLYFCSWHCLRAWQAAEARKEVAKRLEEELERREMIVYGTTEEKRVKVRELLKQGKTIDEIKREVHCGYVLVKEVADALSAEQQAGEAAVQEETALEKSPGGISAEAAPVQAQRPKVHAKRFAMYNSDFVTLTVDDAEQYVELEIDSLALEDDAQSGELHIDKRYLAQIAQELNEIVRLVCGTT